MSTIYFSLCAHFVIINTVLAGPSIKSRALLQRNSSAHFDIMFPEEDTMTMRLSANSIPKCPQNASFCEDVEQYPKDVFTKILADTFYNKEYFKEMPADTEEDLNTRFGTEQEYYICPSFTKTIFPKVAESVQRQWRFIYNFDGYRQGVRIEICRRENSCNLFGEPPMGIITQCKQKYIERRLLSADSNGKPIVDYFRLPSSCACSYRRDIRFNSYNRYKRQLLNNTVIIDK